MKAKLTARTVEAAKPADKPYEMHDTDLRGLILRVQPSGIKSFVVTWARGKRRTLGRYPVMTVTGARQAALAALSEAAQHGAPVAVLEAAKPAPATLERFLEDHFDPWAKEHHKSAAENVASIRHVFAHLLDRKLSDISPFDIERVKAARLKAGRKPATVNRDLDRIRGVLSRAVEWNMLSEHPMKPVKRVKGGDTGRVRYLTPAEDKRLRTALSKREGERRKARASYNAWAAARGRDERPLWPEDGFTDHLMPLVLVALNTGLRRGELFGLRWEDVNLPRQLLTVQAGNAKSSKVRHVPLNVEAVDVLRRWKRQADKAVPLVFPGKGGGRMTNINKSWAGLVGAATITNFTFHDCRHDFASKLVMAGVDLYTVKELLGHASIEMTMRYAHLAPHKLADAVARLGN